jgi:hypothetical protein
MLMRYFRNFFVGVLCVLSLNIFQSSETFAWGKRGHEIVSSVATQLLVKKRGDQFLSSHEFDMGYYANVPDIIWRNIDPSKQAPDVESVQHFLDWNQTMAQIFKTPANLPINFNDYKSQMGKTFDRKLGLAPWRISNLIEQCRAYQSLIIKSPKSNSALEAQAKLLSCLGEMSHYTGDMSQPLHVTDNFDGWAPAKTGIHAFFETEVVNALGPDLKVHVLHEALEHFDDIASRKMTNDQAVRFLIAESNKHFAEILNIDVGLDRHDLSKAKKSFNRLIIDRLSQGAIITALIWDTLLTDVNKSWSENHFYIFDASPDYLFPLFESEK